MVYLNRIIADKTILLHDDDGMAEVRTITDKKKPHKIKHITKLHVYKYT
jgi:hypothetical protein